MLKVVTLMKRRAGLSVEEFQDHLRNIYDPLAAKGVPPFQVVHRWREDGRPREHTQLIGALPATYTIETAADPEMISVAAEMP